MYAIQQEAIGEQANAKLRAHLAQLAKASAGWVALDQIKAFVNCFDHLPRHSGYKYVPASAHVIQQEILQSRGDAASRGFLYACMLQGLLKCLSSEAFAALPVRIKGHQLKQYGRILDKSTVIIETCELDSDLFHKDLGLALMRLYAAAAQMVDHDAGIGRAILFADGATHLPVRLALFAKLGGFKPFFEIHTHLSYLDEFTEEGWNECYRCCADLYAIHPHVLGMQGGSWFYDPALAAISPRLAYLREVPKKGGAHLLYASTDAHLVHDATSTSPTRKKLYEDGQYRPKSFTLIWPRADQIEWAKSNAAAGAPT